MARFTTIILPGAGMRTRTSWLSWPGVLPLYYQELGLEPRPPGYCGPVFYHYNTGSWDLTQTSRLFWPGILP
jgi:hypothetical protein